MGPLERDYSSTCVDLPLASGSGIETPSYLMHLATLLALSIRGPKVGQVSMVGKGKEIPFTLKSDPYVSESWHPW